MLCFQNLGHIYLQTTLLKPKLKTHFPFLVEVSFKVRFQKVCFVESTSCL